MTLLEIKNIQTDKFYYMEKSSINNNLVELYKFNGARLSLCKLIGNKTLKDDYVIIAILEI